MPLTDEIIDRAAKRALEPLVTRAYSIHDVRPEYLDSHTAALSTKPNNRLELFALSMSDFFQAWDLAESLPLLAVAVEQCRDVQNERKLHSVLVAQLEEISIWLPLNRPGWTLYEPGGAAEPGFNDGSWLGTGLGIRALTQTLGICRSRLPAQLQQAIGLLLEREVSAVRDDFASRRPWYWNTPVSNQFVLPNTGVILACIELGIDLDTWREPYEASVKNIMRALDAQGADGSHHEGAHYGSFTNKEILYAAHTMNRAGDSRLVLHPHIRNFGKWLVHSLQPGGLNINSFDGTDRIFTLEQDRTRKVQGMLSPTHGQIVLDCLMLCALIGQNDTMSMLDRYFPALYPSALALQYQKYTERAADVCRNLLPVCHGVYSASPLVTWRTSWDDDADGVWLRGGSARDNHDHRDRGHVNYIADGREVLMEAGRTDYADEHYDRDYASETAHNVLQIGEKGQNLAGGIAQINVKRLDGGGGEATIDCTGAYSPNHLSIWNRRVLWNSEQLSIHDSVVLAKGTQDTLLFRFHLGQVFDIEMTSDQRKSCWQVIWPGGRCQFESNIPLTVGTVTMPHGVGYTSKSEHTCLLVRSVRRADAIELSSCFYPVRKKSLQNSIVNPLIRERNKIVLERPADLRVEGVGDEVR